MNEHVQIMPFSINRIIFQTEKLTNLITSYEKSNRSKNIIIYNCDVLLNLFYINILENIYTANNIHNNVQLKIIYNYVVHKNKIALFSNDINVSICSSWNIITFFLSLYFQVIKSLYLTIYLKYVKCIHFTIL